MFFFFSDCGEASPSLGLERFHEALDVVHGRYPDLSLGMLRTFLCAAETSIDMKTATVATIAERSRQKYSSVARQIDLLGVGAIHKPGLHLLDKQLDHEDRRIRHVALSDEGRSLLQELDMVLAPDLLESR